MSVLNAWISCEGTLTAYPSFAIVNTNDTLATVTTVGYLNGINPLPLGYSLDVAFADGQLAIIKTTDYGTVDLRVEIIGGNTSLLPKNPVTIPYFSTAPANSQWPSFSIGTPYQNNFGYDVMLTVYLNITSAESAYILLGVGNTYTPTQQTIVANLSLSSPGIIPVNIYLPKDYYANLSTSGTISLSVSGQIAMPI